MGKVLGGGSSTSKSTSESNPWQPAQSNLKEILGDISSWYGDAQDTGYISGTGDLAPIYQQYLQGLNGYDSSTGTGYINSGISGMSNLANQYGGVANGSLNYTTNDILNSAGALYNNELVQSQINAANQQIDDTLLEQTFTGIDRNAVAGGNMGSSRAGVAQAIAARDAATAKANNANTITSNAYNNAINTAANTLGQNVNTQLQGLSGQGNAYGNLYNMGSSYGNSYISNLSPLLEYANLQGTIQGQEQTDQIGDRDYIANLISQYYLPVSSTIGGLGGSSTQKTSTPGQGFLSSVAGLGQSAANIYSGFGFGK